MKYIYTHIHTLEEIGSIITKVYMCIRSTLREEQNKSIVWLACVTGTFVCMSADLKMLASFSFLGCILRIPSSTCTCLLNQVFFTGPYVPTKC